MQPKGYYFEITLEKELTIRSIAVRDVIGVLCDMPRSDLTGAN